MSIRGLQPQTLAIPLAAGLQTKTDPRALEAPGLTICTDAQFDEIGGIQLRKPFATKGTAILGGGTIADVRRIVENGEELIAFTKSALYSYNAQSSNWVNKGTYLAVKVAEASSFVTTGDQIDADRAELNGVVFFSWSEGTRGYVAARDTTTGAVVLAPYLLNGFQRIRLTALATRVLLTFYDGIGGIYCYSMDPLSPTTALAGASTTMSSAAGSFSVGPFYDVAKIPGLDSAAFVVGAALAAAYTIGTVTAALAVARLSKARSTDGPISLSCEPLGASVQVARGVGTDMLGDLITISTLADVYINQAVGTYAGTLNQIAMAHRSVADSSVYRCYAFWSSGEAVIGNFLSKSNWVSTGNTLGVQVEFVRDLGVVSRAFDHDGRVFAWLGFGGESSFSGASPSAFRAQIQNTYFLYRDDEFLAAKSSSGRSGGFASTRGLLPGMQSLGSGVYAWAGTERRIIPIGENQSGYGARAPREIKFTFDSNEARRCVRLGATLYISGGEVMQYDGMNITEVGFHMYPYYFGGIEVAAGNLEDGVYTYKLTWRWDNAQGELDRSTTATTGQMTIAGGPNGVNIPSWRPLFVTHKAAVAVEVWRTPVNATDDSPFYLVTSKDPAALTNPNRYIANDTEASSLPSFNDEFADTVGITKESNPENFGVLEQLAPPAATVIAASADRIFLAGIAGDPHRVVYSRLRTEGDVASFNDALSISIPPSGSAITALAFLNETLVVFKETAIYALPGDGYDNTGGGSNYGPARLLSADLGAVNAESVAVTPHGLIFKSLKGWQMLGAGWAVQYIGAPVADYDAEAVQAVHVIESQHQIRCMTSSRCLVWDYLVGQWATWTIASAVGATIWNGAHVYATATDVLGELQVYTGVNYALDIETAWIPMGQIQGFGRVWRLSIIGEYRGAHRLRVRLAKNYATAYFQDKSWTVSPIVVGDTEQIEHRPSVQEMQAIKIRITGEHPAFNASPPVTEALKLTSLALEIGLERGLNRLPAAQRQ